MSKCISVGVVDDHNDALNFYYKLIARKKIPFDDLCLVHFDSHPDLAAPESIPVDQFTDRKELLDNLTIADWILPAVYQGHFTTVVWIKPPWSTQIHVGEHEIELGVDDKGLLRTSSILPYYLSDMNYVENLHHTRTFTLHVIELSHLDKETSKEYELLAKILHNRQWCLDFDMDFYSTQNPFLNLLGPYFNFIDSIFKFKDLGDFQKSLTYRKAQLDSLEKLCSSSEVENNLPLSDEQEEFMSSLKHKYPDWAECIKQAKLLAKDDEFITDLFYIGQQTELPHHLSKKSEIRTLLCKTETSLKLLKSTPVAITLARSEYDEYSTQKTLDFVHCELVCMMRRLYRIPSEIGCPKL